MVDILSASAGRTKTNRKKAKATKKKVARAGATNAARKAVTAKPKKAVASVVTIEGKINDWLCELSSTTGRSKREVTLEALKFAQDHDEFSLEAHVPSSVKKWLAKTGRSIA